MTKNMPLTAVRRTLRGLALVPALALVTAAGPALAAPPEAWPDADNGSALHSLLLLGGIPALLFVAIWLLVSLPSMMSRQKYDPAVAFRDEPEWFGGPRQGADAAPAEAGEGKDRGGAGANW